MALFDNYFTNEDKPFAENLNDALLVSNVFDFTVPIVLPTMFSNNTWVDTTSPRKCGVAIATLKEALPSGISVGTSSGNSTLTGTGTVKLLFYPNFNTFGKFKAINWESSNNKIQVNLKKKNGTSIASNISKGNLSVNITDLEELLIEIVFTATDTLTSFTVTMENKDSNNRYGANVKIQSVDGLSDELSSIENDTRWTDNRNPLANDITPTSATDIDNFNDIGFYAFFNNSAVASMTSENKAKLPSGLGENSFYLLVEKRINYTKQTLTKYNDGRTWIRTKSSSIWSDWKELSTVGHTHTKSEVTDFAHTHDDRYYTESEVNTALNGKANSSHTHTKSEVTDFAHTHGNISNAGAIGSASGKIITTTTSGVLTASDTITKSKISDFPSTMTPTSHTHGNLTNAGAIGSSSGQIITTTTNGVLTASSTITKSKISDFPSTMTPSSHTHGNISNDGKIGSSSGKLIVTGNNGVLSAVDNIDKSKVNNFNKEVVDIVYPIGSIYMSVNSTSPSILFGGTWEQLKDKFLLASGDTYSNGATGGSADATLVSHNHGTSTSGELFVTSASDEANNTRVTYSSTGNRYVDGMTDGTTPFHHRFKTESVGSSATGKNMPPYLVVNVWKRTA